MTIKYPIILGVLIALSGCATWRHDSPLLDQKIFFDALPKNYHWHAALLTKNNARRTSYILVLSTVVGREKLTLLTANGLPVLAASAEGQKMTVQQKLKIDESLKPQTLITYILLMFGDEDVIREQIRHQGYKMNTSENKRVLRKNEPNSSQIIIYYNGTNPWYNRVLLNHGDESLRVESLEIWHVLPE